MLSLPGCLAVWGLKMEEVGLALVFDFLTWYEYRIPVISSGTQFSTRYFCVVEHHWQLLLLVLGALIQFWWVSLAWNTLPSQTYPLPWPGRSTSLFNLWYLTLT